MGRNLTVANEKEKPNAQQPFCKNEGFVLYDSEVLNPRFMHLMKFSAENPHLRQAPNRYRAF